MSIEFDLLTILIFAIIYIGIVLFLKIKQKKSTAFLFFFTVFFVYIVSAIKYTQFPIYLSEYMRAVIGQNVWKNMNLIPFHNFTRNSINTSSMNILLTVPFGFGLPFLAKLNFRKITLAGLFFSITLEILQLIVALMAGFTFRIVDINDVVFNTFGAVVGYGLFVAFIRIFRLVIDKWKIEKNFILSYIYKR